MISTNGASNCVANSNTSSNNKLRVISKTSATQRVVAWISSHHISNQLTSKLSSEPCTIGL